MRTSRIRAAALLLGVAAACSEPVATSNRLPGALDPALNVTPTGSLSSNIANMITTLFPTGLVTAAGERWETLKANADAGRTDSQKAKIARQQFVNLSSWIRQRVSQMPEPTNGETREAAATRLVTYMAMYVFNGEGEPPSYNPEIDATFAIIQPSQPATVTTPAGFAGVGVEANSVAEPSVLTISESPIAYPATCSGPLVTKRCQYPLFYDYHIFPVQKFLRPVHVAVCHRTYVTSRPPLDAPNSDAVHDRLRLAHPLPADPANYTATATQYSGNGESIEVAQLSPLQGSSGVNCNPQTIGMTPMERMIGRLASAIGRVISPPSLYAVDQGPEHMFEFFSPINLVDPMGRPDLAVQNLALGGATPPRAGEAVSVSFNVANTSPVGGTGGQATAASKPTYYHIYLEQGTASERLDSADVSALTPDATGAVTTSVTIPSGKLSGNYQLRVYVRPIEIAETIRQGGVAATAVFSEVSTANNVATIPLVVAPRLTSITVAPSAATLETGQTQAFTATALDDHGNPMTGVAVSWTSSAAGVATVDASGLATAVAPGSTTITASSGSVSGSATLTVSDDFVNEDFCGTTTLQLVGNAVITTSPCVLRLTAPSTGQAGAAWKKSLKNVGDGFRTTIRFQFSNPGGSDGTNTGADGIAFVIQGVGTTALGAGGGGIGYSGIANAVAIELDTWNNSGAPTGSSPGNNDPSSDHIALRVNGSPVHVPGDAAATPNLNDGEVHELHIAYSGETLTAYLDNATTPLLSLPLSLAGVVDANGRAYVGITSATGAAFAQHDILRWRFNSGNASVIP